MKITFFGTQPYDRESFDRANASFGFEFIYCNSGSKHARRPATKRKPPGGAAYFLVLRYSVGDSPVCFLK